jgi:hypothetical protein
VPEIVKRFRNDLHELFSAVNLKNPQV